MKKPTTDQWMGIALGLMALLIATLALIDLGGSGFKGIAPVGRGEPMPAIDGRDLGGERVALAQGDAGGQVLLVDFWATWCPPCREEMPILADLQTRYADQGLRLIAVNTDVEDSATAQARLVRAYLQTQKLELPVVLDDGSLQSRFNVQSLPTLFVIGRDGLVREVYVGAASARTLERAVKAALEES